MSDQVNIEEGFTPDPKIMEAIEAEETPVTENAESTDTPEVKAEEAPEQTEEAPAETTEETKEVNPLEFTVGGKTREYTAHEIKSALGRQRKLDEVMGSSEYKMGLLIKAAESGDKGAQKKMQELLVKFTDSEDADGMVDKLEEEKGEFDEEGKAKEQLNKVSEDEFFADVKDSVDYEDNLAKIDSSLKPRIPEKLFNQFSANPSAKRAMYDLVASGRMETLLNAFELELNALPLEKRLDVLSDPETYGREFTNLVKRENAKQTQPQTTEQKQSEDNSNSDLDAVSTAPSGRTNNQTPSEPDFEKMTDAEFDQFRRDNGLTV